MKAPYITKGTKIRVSFYAAEPASLAGMQMKVSAAKVDVVGTCVHFRGDHPTEPKETRIYIDVTQGALPEPVKLVKPYGCTHETGHLEVREEWIVGIEKDGQVWGKK